WNCMCSPLLTACQGSDPKSNQSFTDTKPLTNSSQPQQQQHSSYTPPVQQNTGITQPGSQLNQASTTHI
ncbi:unnamed protein product, partial [Didymodactylos carnosus]